MAIDPNQFEVIGDQPATDGRFELVGDEPKPSLSKLGFDMSKVGEDPYYKFKLQEDAAAKAGLPLEDYSQSVPASLNPNYDFNRATGYGGPIAASLGLAADAAGKGIVKLADIPTRISNIGKTPESPGYRETLEEREARGPILKLPRVDTKDLKGVPAVVAGLENTALGTAESFIGKPSSSFMLPLLGGEGALAKTAAGVYGVSAAAQVPDAVKKAIDVYNDPDATTAEKTQAIANPVVQGVLSYGMLKHAAGPRIAAEAPGVMGSELKIPQGAEAPPLRVEDFSPLDTQSGSPISPQELINRQSRTATPDVPEPVIKTFNLDEDDAPTTTPAPPNDPVARAFESVKSETNQKPPQASEASAAQLVVRDYGDRQPEEIAALPDDEFKKLVEAKDDTGKAKMSVTVDATAWALKHPDADPAQLDVLRDQAIENQKKNGGYDRSQWFADAAHALRGNEVGNFNKDLVSKMLGIKPQAASVGPGLGAAKYGEVNGPKTPLTDLENQIHILSEQSPVADKQKEAFNIGEKLQTLKDGVSENLMGLKSAGKYLQQKLIGKPVVTDIKRAIGNRHLALTDSAINARQFVDTAKKKIPSKLIQEAISDYVDTGGDKALLEKAANETKRPYYEGYKRAQNLTPDEITVANNIRQYFDTRLDDAIKNGILEDGIEDYIHRYYQTDTPWKKGILAELRSGIFTGKPALAKKRVFDYDFEAEKAGLKPVKSFISRVAAYDLSLNKAIADRNIVKEMTQIKMPDGRPMVDVAGVGIPSETKDAGAMLIKPSAKPNSEKPIDNRGDYRPFDAPALRRWKWVGTDSNGNPILLQGDVLVHPDAMKDVRALFERSRIRANPVGRIALAASSTVKQTMLDLSAFHPVQIAVHGLEHRSYVPFGEYDAKFLGKEFRPLTDYINDPQVRGLVRGGMVMGETTGRELFHEGLSGSSLTKHIPGVGPKLAQYSDWLFNDYIPRLKAETGLHALERNRAKYPELSEEQLYQQTADQMNAAFGEQNYEMIGRSKTMQDALRLAFLAPDFLESRVKFAGQAGTKYGREQFKALMLGAATMFVVSRLLNKAIDGEYHMEKKNIFSVVYKGKAYSLRTVQGDILQAATDPEKFLRHRLNPLYGRTAMEAVTQRDEFGRTRDAKQQLKDFAQTIVPISVRGVLNPREQNLMESVLNAVGVTEHRASSTSLVYDLANKYKQQNKIAQEPGEFIYDPDKDPYRPIRQAATFSSPETVASEIKRAVSEGKKVEELKNHFARYAASPFVGSKKNESKFFKSLDADNQKIYRDAKLEKQKVLQNFNLGLALWRRQAASP